MIELESEIDFNVKVHSITHISKTAMRDRHGYGVVMVMTGNR